MRLIDADQFGVISLQGKSDDFIEGVKFILEKIDEAPTVEERPHGRWLPVGKYGDRFICSECKEHNDYAFDKFTFSFDNFCPNCGAKMGVKTDFN